MDGWKAVLGADPNAAGEHSRPGKRLASVTETVCSRFFLWWAFGDEFEMGMSESSEVGVYAVARDGGLLGGVDVRPTARKMEQFGAPGENREVGAFVQLEVGEVAAGGGPHDGSIAPTRAR